MQGVFIEILHISLFTGVLIGVLFFATKLLQKRYSARWRSILWIIITFRLLLVVPLPFLSLPSFSSNFLISSSDEVLVTVSMIESMSDETPSISEITSVRLSTIEQFFVDPSTSFRLNDIQIFMYIWFIGIVIFLLIHLCAYVKFHNRLKNSNAPPIPKHIWNLLEEQSRLLGLKKFPKPRITTAIDSPVLIGLFYPQILLPHGNYTNNELTLILRHELIHYKRKDIFYKWILLLAKALHWFNPLVYLMANQVTNDMELSCDDYVVGTLADFELKQYCRVLISTLPTNHIKYTKKNIVLTEMGDNAKEMKKRLCNILDRSHRRRGVFALCSLVMCVIITTSIVRTSYTTSAPDFEQFIAVSNSNSENIWNREVIETQEPQITIYNTDYVVDWDSVHVLSLPITVNLLDWEMIHVPTVGVIDLRISHVVEPAVVHGALSHEKLYILIPMLE